MVTRHLHVMKRSEMISALMKKNRASVHNQYASIAKARIRNTSEIVVIAWVAVNHCKSITNTIFYQLKNPIQLNTIFFLESSWIGQSHQLDEQILSMVFPFHKIFNLLPTKTVISNKVFAGFIGHSITWLKISDRKHKYRGNTMEISTWNSISRLRRHKLYTSFPGPFFSFS